MRLITWGRRKFLWMRSWPLQPGTFESPPDFRVSVLFVAEGPKIFAFFAYFRKFSLFSSFLSLPYKFCPRVIFAFFPAFHKFSLDKNIGNPEYGQESAIVNGFRFPDIRKIQTTLITLPLLSKHHPPVTKHRAKIFIMEKNQRKSPNAEKLVFRHPKNVYPTKSV